MAALPLLAALGCGLTLGFLIGVFWHMGNAEVREARLYCTIDLLRARLDSLAELLEDDACDFLEDEPA